MAYADPNVACEPWTTADKLCSTGAGDSIDCDGVTSPLDFKWGVDDVIAAATNLLFKRTCFRYPGMCTREVIPCICGHGPALCSCGYEPTIELTSDFPIHSVTSVVIKEPGVADVTLPNTAYRLDEHARLVRIDGEHWPACRASVHVTFVTGRTPPIELQMAAAELADELLKACGGAGDCKLPTHVRSVSRRNVEMEVWDVVALMQTGMTGNPIIDHALSVHGGRCRKTSMFDATRVTTTQRVS